ncbi:MAG: DNA repair protein RecO [Bdellovibrionales bacterium]|nr:DNA repair protein RecO [Oligoflexia bacterium]
MDTPPNRELCYVLRTIPFRERDLVAVLFSESRGKFSAIARNGVQSRRFGGSLNLFTASDFEIDPKTVRLTEVTNDILVQLVSAQARHASEGISKSFERLSGASALNEMILKIVPEHKAIPEVFKLYSNCLFALNDSPSERAICIVNAFILKMTQWLGVQPSLTRCMQCEKSLGEVNGNLVYPQIEKGAWLCQDCRTPDTRKALTKTVMLDAYHSMLNPVRKIEFQATQAEHENLLEFLEKHLQYFVPGLDKAPISSLRFLKFPQLPL